MGGHAQHGRGRHPGAGPLWALNCIPAADPRTAPEPGRITGMSSRDPEVDRYLWRNYLAHTIEGGLYMGGLTFVMPMVVVTYLINEMNGPAILTAIVPVMLSIGFLTPPLFMAHILETLRRYKPVIMVTGVFQRLPYLAAGLALIYLADSWPVTVVYLVAFTPFVSGLTGGISSTAWMGLVARTIPGDRLCSVWAMRLIIRDILGICAGMIAAGLLKAHPGTGGYGRLHLIAFGFLVLSYLVFALIRETGAEAAIPQPRISMRRNFAQGDALIRTDQRLRRYIVSKVCLNSIYIVIPFLSTFALRKTGLDASYLGWLLGCCSMGSIVGNILAAYIGDRRGPRVLLLMCRAVLMVLCVWTFFAGTLWEFCALYSLYGLGMALLWVGNPTFRIAISPEDKRHTFLGITAFINIPSMLFSSTLCALLWDLTNSLKWGAGLALAGLAISTLYLMKIPLEACPSDKG
ncbi:MFS transporter [Planctomycetota bacterium]